MPLADAIVPVGRVQGVLYAVDEAVVEQRHGRDLEAAAQTFHDKDGGELIELRSEAGGWVSSGENLTFGTQSTRTDHASAIENLDQIDRKQDH